MHNFNCSMFIIQIPGWNRDQREGVDEDLLRGAHRRPSPGRGALDWGTKTIKMKIVIHICRIEIENGF